MLRKFLNLFRPGRLDADLHAELEFHRSQTKGSLGNLALVKEGMRDASTIVWLETMLQDVRYGLRQLAKTPVLVTVAVLSLAIGIGANTAIFTLINAVMFQSLPVRDPARLVLFYDGIATGVYSGGNPQSDEFSYPFCQYLETHNDSFESLAAFRQSNDPVILHIVGAKDTGPGEHAAVHLVSGNYFDVLGVQAAAGRVLIPSDNSLSAPRVAILSYPFWRDRFHLDPAILGREVVLNGTAFTIVGVADRQFFGERIQTAPDFWLPLSAEPQILLGESKPFLDARDVYWLNVIGRLKPGATLERAQSAVNHRLQQFYLEQAGTRLSPQIRRKIQNTHIQLKPGAAGISGARYLYSKPLHILMAVVAVVLLIACANIATLLLARASARRQEFLARLALGASRARLLRQVLTESILLSVLGGLAGAGFAWWSVRLLVLFFLRANPAIKVKPDPDVLAFTLSLTILTGVLFGIFPALKFSRLELRPGNIRRPAAIGKWRFGAGDALIALQVALSLILLLGAGLLAHSLLALERQNIGFQRDNVLVIRTDTSLAGYRQSELFPLYRDIADRLAQLPGVTSASIARFTPESGHSSSGNFSIEGYTESPGKLNVYDVPVAPCFFETLGIPLRLGRTIGASDTPASPAVAIVNQSFVHQYLLNQNPLGRHIMLGAPFKAPGAEIVGVVADSKYYDLRAHAQPMAFFSLWQKPVPDIEIVLRTAAAPSGVMAEVRQALKQVSSKLPILGITTLNSQIEKSLDREKTITTLCGIFGLLALILAAIGIYGTLAYSVAGRTAEIGIRMAIGAQRRNVVWMVLRDSLVLIALGLVAGLPLALGTTRWLKSFLFGIREIDPLAIAAAVVLISTLAVLAGYLPARRAARIDPMRALRHE